MNKPFLKEEIVDVIDENLNVLYQAPKKEAHEKGLLHPIIIAEIIDKKGNFVLVKQAEDRQDPGKYVSPVGGHIKAGEDFVDALKREALEEAGFYKFKHKFIKKVHYKREVIGRIENHMFLVYEIYSDWRPRLNEEAVDFERFSKDELKELIKIKPDMFGGAFWVVFENCYPELFE